MSRFGAALEHHRQAAGISQRELARRLEISNADISQWEAGKREPPRSRRDLIMGIEDALGLANSELLLAAGLLARGEGSRVFLDWSGDIDDVLPEDIDAAADLIAFRVARRKGEI
ncbi:helix-turn-helix transcriptional regulator [bacterium]|nr:helix-turn-helix transcriptional regulator [bacterium]